METVASAGARIPALGFGTFELEPDEAHRMVRHVLRAGYRHVDTAQMYGNEAAVGRAVRESGLPREEVFVATKVWIEHFRDGELQRSADASLERMGLDDVDLLLLHWPNPDVDLGETIGALLDARDSGRARHVGISNFPSDLMRVAVGLAGPDRIVTNQVEYHPFLRQDTVLAVAAELGMAVTAYCPLARGRVFGTALLKRIGDAHGKNAGQVALRWLLDQGIVALPRSRCEVHADANLDVFDLRLSADDHAAIDRELLGARHLIDPGFAPAWDPP